MYIPYGRQVISKDDIQDVVNVLQSDFITQGPVTPHFENIVAEYCRRSSRKICTLPAPEGGSRGKDTRPVMDLNGP